MLVRVVPVFFGVALWLGSLFALVGGFWLLIRKINRVDKMIRQLAATQKVSTEPENDGEFVRKLVLAYLAALLGIVAIMAAMMAFPQSSTSQFSDFRPARLQEP